MSSAILLPIGVCIVLMLLAFLRIWQTTRKTQQQRRTGVALLLTLIELIKLSQQHRGMHSGLLNGQISLRPKLKELEQQIDSLQQGLYQQRHSLNQRTYAYLQSAITRWQKIMQQPAMEASVSFQQHSGLIARLLDSLWDIADDFSITTHSNPKIQQQTQILVRTLPVLSESIGQIRALTMQVANSERCTPDKKLQLLFTLSKIDADIQLISSDTSTDALEKVTIFTCDIRQSIEQDTLSQQNPDVVFQRATENIDRIFQLITQGLTALQQRL
ncbi:hypothetical protein [Reinekea thalattae]|uniref:Nitrate/nitrite sensing protein domain-containing protein n=1 Tax=Reinekea thalattae TaxID=2593301 RepID=A0A5C8ZB14_9GAMM|nr:hypothetical protein [Reinekea thalattae]TXR54381.1 hypothetical protein FME95_07540 [Reinekea thalattae]